MNARKSLNCNLKLQGVDLKSMDLEASVDVRAMASAALRQLTVADVNLLKAIIAAGLYPQVCPTQRVAFMSHRYKCMSCCLLVMVEAG